MDRELIRAGAVLPQLPVPIFPLDGVNLRAESLVLREGFQSAEHVIAHFRQENSPERQPHYRRYYLRPHMRGGVFKGKHSMYFAWNLGAPSTDRFVGIIKGEDVPAAQIVIGNNVFGTWMTPIRWELSEDRDGENMIAAGRFDPWSLLQDITPSDLERLGKEGIVPQVSGWDFDKFFLDRECPGCGKKVSVNMFAYDIDSAECCHCGIRPFLSGSLVSHMEHLLPEITGEGFGILRAKAVLSHIVGWLGCVGASVKNLHQESLPKDTSPHQVLQMISQRCLPSPSRNESDIETLISGLFGVVKGTDEFSLALSATSILMKTIEEGGPFTETHAAMAKLLETMEQKKGS